MADDGKEKEEAPEKKEAEGQSLKRKAEEPAEVRKKIKGRPCFHTGSGVP